VREAKATRRSDSRRAEDQHRRVVKFNDQDNRFEMKSAENSTLQCSLKRSSIAQERHNKTEYYDLFTITFQKAMLINNDNIALSLSLSLLHKTARNNSV
jgi:hypothetical protein